MGNQEQPPKGTGSRKRLVTYIVVAVVALLVVIGILVVVIIGQMNKGYDRYAFDTSALEGRIQMMTEEEIQAELNRVVEEGMFNISIASAIIFENPKAEGQARIENIAANRYHMQVDILLDETGETLYSSKLIQPGYSVEYITLDKELPPGEYEATAIFSAITQKELQVFGTAGAKITLYVFDGVVPTPTPTPTPTPMPTETPMPTATPDVAEAITSTP